MKREDDDLIDYDFLKSTLRPPKRPKKKQTDTLKETGRLLREINRLLDMMGRTDKKKQEYTRRTSTRPQKGQMCMVKMHYFKDRGKHVKFLRSYMPQENKKEVEDKPELFNAKKMSFPLKTSQNMRRRPFHCISVS